MSSLSVIQEEDQTEFLQSTEAQDGGRILETKLMSIISKFYQLEMYGFPGLRCGKATFFLDPNIHIPDFGDKVDVNQIGDSLTFEFEVPEELEASVSLSSSKKDVPTYLKYQLRHNFVAEALSTHSTDVSLKDSFGPLQDENDVLTPDFVLTDGQGRKYVIELATSRSTNQRILEESFDLKRFKYHAALQDRATDSIVSYVIVVVTPIGVLCNIRLPITLVNELVTRMKIALAVENVAMGKGIRVTQSEDEEILSRTAQEIRDGLSYVAGKDRPPSDRLYITSDYIESILTPPDSEVVAKAFGTARKEGLKGLFEAINNPVGPDSYVESLINLNPSRSDRKPVVLLPLVIPKVTLMTSNIAPISILPAEGHRTISRLWAYALRYPSNNPKEWSEEDTSILIREALETDQAKVEKLSKLRKEKRKTANIVDFGKILTPTMKHDLARDGIYGKRYSSDLRHIERLKQQKYPFNWLTSLDDIDSFLDSEELFQLHETEDIEDPFRTMKSLIEKADLLAGNSGFKKRIVEDWCGTKIMRWLDMISDIGMELACSIKRNTGYGKMILKKLKRWNVYMLISPTNSRSHLFVSFFFPNGSEVMNSNCNPTYPLVDVRSGHLTEFVSFRADKIENLVTASSSFIPLVSQWSHYCGIPQMDVESVKSNRECRRLILFSLLVKLEDKASTEESITNTRYMYMEIFKNGPCTVKPNPFKILKKMTNHPRSRLTLWVIKQAIESFSMMMTKPPTRVPVSSSKKTVEGEDSLPGDEWDGLVNFVTKGHVRTAGQCIELIYIGYLKNKNEVGQGNSDWKLVEKIIEEEMTLNMNEKSKSLGEVPPAELPGKKQFNKECIKFGSHLLEKRLRSIYGQEWKKLVTYDILENLSKQLTFEIATLKASSSLDASSIKHRVTSKTNDEIHRIKVIEAVACKLQNMDLNPMLRINSFIEYLETTIDGVICDIFSKNQHGGIREIYVLNIESRIVQLFIETISRTLCQYFEEETLTHPSNKLRLLDNHKMQSAKMAAKKNCVYSDYCNSSDKTRWNQNFVMPAMCIPLIRMTEPVFHNSIQRILNLWANKLIKIPPSVCSLLLNRTMLSSDAYADLFQKFWTGKKGKTQRNYLREHCASFLNLTSGMMQGILHYTSSLLHLTFLQASTALCLKFLRTRNPKWKFTMTQICSSDDSATILSLFSQDDAITISAKELVVISDTELMMFTLPKFCTYFCMRESEKSTICLYDYIEFNSEFILKNTLVKPKIKLVAASLNLTESESYIQRFHTQYNLLSDLYGAGMPGRNTSLVQIGQLWVHYKTLGINMTRMFDEWMQRALAIPSPIFGFFVLDTERMPGVMGWSFCHWLAISADENLAKFACTLDKSELEVLPDGGVVQALLVKHGDSQKYHSLLDVITYGEARAKNRTMKKDRLTGETKIDTNMLSQRLEWFEKHKMLLFRNPRSIEELRMKLLMKASMPGVAKSLGKGNPFIQAVCMSVYSIFSHCFTKINVVTKTELSGVVKLGKTVSKTNLLIEMDLAMSTVTKEESTMDIERVLKAMFPLSSKYEEASQVINMFNDAVLNPIHRMRHRKSVIMIQPRMSELPLTLYQCVTHKWFGFPIRTTEKVFKRCMDSYEFEFPFVSETLEETLRRSHFSTYLELYFFLSSQVIRPRKLLFVGPGVYSDMFIGQIYQLIRKNYLSAHLLELGERGEKLKYRIKEPIVELSLALQIPHTESRNKLASEILITKFPHLPEPSVLKSIPYRELACLLSSAYLRGDIELSRVIEILNLSGRGTLISFTKVQERTVIGGKVKWEGEGEAICVSEGIVMKVMLEGDVVTRVSTNKPQELSKHPAILREVFEKLSARPLRKRTFATQCVCRFNGQRMSHRLTAGTPIINDPTIGGIYLDSDNIRFLIRYNSCGFYAKIRGEPKAILEFRAMVKDLTVINDGSPSDSFWKAWVEYRPVKAGAAISFILRVHKNLKTSQFKGTDKNRILEWLQSTLKNRISYKCVGFQVKDQLSSIGDQSPGEDLLKGEELDDLLLDMMDLEGINDMDEFSAMTVTAMEETKNRMAMVDQDELSKFISPEDMLEDIEFSVKISDDNDFTMLFNNYAQLETPHTRTIQKPNRLYDYLHLHPLWDDLIQEVTKNDPYYFSKILQGILPMSNDNLPEVFMEVLEIKQKVVETGLLERLLRRGGNIEEIFMEDSSPSESETIQNNDEWWSS